MRLKLPGQASAHPLAAVAAGLLALCTAATAHARGPMGARDADYHTAVAQAHKRYAADGSGKVTKSIPALASVSPDLYGIAIVRVDGKAFEAGDVATPFVLTSLATPFSAALTAEQRGLDRVSGVLGAIAGTTPVPPGRSPADWGKAPTSALAVDGALATLSLVQPQGDAPGKWRALLDNLAAFAGRELAPDAAILASAETSSGRLMSTARELSEDGRLAEPAQDTAELYLRQGAVAVTTHDLAVMAATLANEGVNPVSEKRVVGTDVAKHIQTLLIDSGWPGGKKQAWLREAGVGAMPASSGAIMMIVPGRMGIAVYSPPLDAAGASVRGQRALRFLTQVLFIGPDPTAPAP